MPVAYPRGFRDDVLAVAGKGEMSIAQVVNGFGIAHSCLRNWLVQDDVEAGNCPGVTKAENEDLKKARRRIRNWRWTTRSSDEWWRICRKKTQNWAKLHHDVPRPHGPGRRRGFP